MICERELQIKDLMNNYDIIYINDMIIEDIDRTHFNFHDTKVDIDNITINYSDIDNLYGEIDENFGY